MEIEKIVQEKTEMQRHYVMVSIWNYILVVNYKSFWYFYFLVLVKGVNIFILFFILSIL